MSPSERTSATFSQGSIWHNTYKTDVPLECRASIDLSPPPSPTMPLTKALLASQPEEFKAATEADFLRLAGAGKVSKSLLSQWLSQDRLYAETYIAFISSLISRVTLPYAFISDKSQSLRWRIIRILTDALTNIHRELEFFTTVAEKYGLDLEFIDGDERNFKANPATQQYMDLFRSFATDPTTPLLEGLVVLWATEACYLSAWRYASKYLNGENQEADKDQDGGALRNEFIPNWTSDDFVGFVDDIAEITDELAEREYAGRKLQVYKAVWLHVLDIEKRFWPTV